jgi:hypothetical protein
MELKSLLETNGPWLHVLVATEADGRDALLAFEKSSVGKCTVRNIRGQKAKTTISLFDEFSAAMQFPSYFGENWNAFDECLADLSWLPANSFICFISHAAQVLEKESANERQTLWTILDRVASEWSQASARSTRPAKPFHVVLHCTKDEEPVLRGQLKALKLSFGQLH